MRGWQRDPRGAGAALLVLLFSLQTINAQQPAPMMGHGGPVRAVAYLSDGATLVSGGFDSAILVWDLQTSTVRRVLRFHDSTVNALVALKDGCFASGGEDGKIALWCGYGAKPVRVFEGHTAPISALAGANDGAAVVSASWDRTVRMWPVGAGEARILTQHAAPVNGVVALAGGSVVSASYDGEVRMTPPSGQGLQARLPAAVNGLAAFQDSQGVVAAGADGHLRRLDQKLAVVADYALPDGPLTAAAISPDGASLLTAGLRTPVTVLDTATGKEKFRIFGPGLPVWALAFSGDGKSLVTGGIDRSIRRWDAVSGKPAGVPVSAPAREEASTDSEDGARVFRACRACHTTNANDAPRAGPTLHGVFGRKIGTAPGYVYSDALVKMDIVWSAETIAKLFEVGPTAYTPGTKMPEQRITDASERKALVEWLRKTTE